MANIVEYITGDTVASDYETLAGAATFADLISTLEGEKLSLFAPSEAVFATTPDQYRWNKQYTKDLLLNHVTAVGDAIGNDETETATALGNDNSITTASGTITTVYGPKADGVAEASTLSPALSIVKAAELATKYVVYDINGFIVPRSQATAATFGNTLLDGALPRLGSLSGSVSQATQDILKNLASTAAEPTFDEQLGYTVFLPTESAFSDLVTATMGLSGVTEYLEDGGLDDALLAHTYVGGAPVTSQEYTSANGKSGNKVIDVDLITPKVTISDVAANILNANPVIFKNGQVHDIDSVLHFPRSTTVGIAQANTETLAELLVAVGLVDDVEGLTRSTVFAPTDAALEPVVCLNNWTPVGDENLKTVLRHHVLDSRVYSSTVDGVSAGGDVATSVAGEVINKDDLDLDASNLNVLGTNGNVHVVNKVLIPPSLKSALPTGTVVDLAVAATPELAKLVVAAGLAPTLAACPGTGKAWTVFAPSDDAFGALTEEDLAYLSANDNKFLKEVLLHHVVSAPAFAADLGATNEFTTLNGDELTVEKVSDVVSVGVDGSKVTAADNKAFNGVVHIIDKVLVPEGVVLPSTKSGSAAVKTVSAISTLLVGAASYLLAAF